MPPGRPLRPALRRKVDELFLRWLSDPDTQRALRDGLRRIRGSAGEATPPATPTTGPGPSPDSPRAPPRGPRAAAAAATAGHAGRDSREATPPATPPPGPGAAPDSPRAPPRGPGAARRIAGAGKVQAPPQAPPPAPQAPPPGRSIPAFFFPRGRPQQPALDVDAAVGRVERVFARFPQERAAPGDMGAVAKACGCPLYWKGPLFTAAGGERSGSVSVHKFVAMWRKVLLTCHDDASKFVQLLGTPGSEGLGPEDFVPFLQDVVNSHPGLSFLKEASEFHSRYITTVIQRIFYAVNRSWSGKITCAELRRSSFLQNVALLEAEPDINQLTEFFSYEHFYVIYCKFWELDADHDLMIDARDLGRHGDHAISSRMIDRIFSGAVTRGRRARKDGKIGYADFVWFLISEEDKTTPTSVEYWFRCMDLDGDGVLSLFELEHFYEEQARRLDARGVEPLPFRDCVCQMLDLVKPRVPGRITLRDLKRCKMAGAFFDAFFNVDKYLEREQREQAWPLRETDGEGPELTDWEKYAAEEYDFLVAEEAAAAGEPWDDDGLEPDPPPRPLFEAPLGAVDLFALADDDDDDDLRLL